MDFWSTFTAECLLSPWMIRPAHLEGVQSVEISTHHVFLIEENLPDEAYSMLSKMVLAIQMKSEDVTILNGEAAVDQLEEMESSKRILCFGEAFPGRFGEKVNWMGHEVIKTHSLESLLNQTQLKKETWVHLKKFGKIK